MNDQKPYFIGILIVSFVTGVIVLISDFGGYYSYSSYIEVWYYINLKTDLWSGISLVLLSSLFFTCSWIAYSSLKKNEISNLKLGTVLSMFSLVVVVAGGISLAIEGSYYDDWWFDTGFYAGLVGGGVLNTILFTLASRTINL